MKKKIIYLILVFSITIFALTFVKLNNKILVLGDYVLNRINNSNKYNYSFSNNNLTSSLLLEYLDHNAYDIQSKNKINKLIKKSKIIYISIGMNDILDYVYLDDNKLKYNTTLINQKIALLEYNVYEIINSILAIKNTQIYFISLYYLNDFIFDEIIKECNIEIKEIILNSNVEFVDINKITKIRNYSFSSENREDIYMYLESS